MFSHFYASRRNCAWRQIMLAGRNYASIMLDALKDQLCSKLCQHNIRTPIRQASHHTTSTSDLSRESTSHRSQESVRCSRSYCFCHLLKVATVTCLLHFLDSVTDSFFLAGHRSGHKRTWLLELYAIFQGGRVARSTIIARARRAASFDRQSVSELTA